MPSKKASMKKIKLMMLLLICLATVSAYAQTNKPAGDTTVTFKVFGACEQCKDRIENAVKMKGVSSGVWDVDSKMLTLVYNTSKVSLQKVQNRIVAVGHDIENKKANISVYNALPACCHYREMENMIEEAATDTAQKIIAAETDSAAVHHMEAPAAN
jgi:copper chaperone CopZ